MITLPDPEDVQVASGWPEVNAFRAALLTCDRARYRVEILRQELADADARIADLHAPRLSWVVRHRERAQGQYQEAVAAYDAAASAMVDAQEAAEEAAPAAADRVRASVEAYAARLARERAADRAR